jgi:hypothetical protein
MLAAIALASLFVGPKEISVPVVARVAGITLGESTIEEFEKRHGRGLVAMGGHSNSGRGWYVPKQRMSIGTDSFNFCERGAILDFIQVVWLGPKDAEPSSKVPRICLPQSEFGILSTLRAGMSKANVEKLLHRKISKEWNLFTGLIQYGRPIVNKGGESRYTEWNAAFGFDHDRLVEFEVSAN